MSRPAGGHSMWFPAGNVNASRRKHVVGQVYPKLEGAHGVPFAKAGATQYVAAVEKLLKLETGEDIVFAQKNEDRVLKILGKMANQI